MSLVHNERVKLTATALNGAAIACFTVGIATPLAAVLYNLGGIGKTLPVSTLITALVLWLSQHSSYISEQGRCSEIFDHEPV